MAASASELGRPTAGRGPGQPRLRGQGLGNADGRRAAAVRRRCRAGARAARDARRRPMLDAARLPHLRRIPEPQRRDPLRGAAGDGSAGVAAGRGRPGAGAIRQPRRRLRDPLLRPRSSRSIWPRSATTSPACSTDAIRPNLPDARVVIELGRYIVGECGVYVTRVVDRKRSAGKTYLVVDGGLHHQLAASGNFGQVIRRNYPVAIGHRRTAMRSERSAWSAACARRSTCSADERHPSAGRGRRPGRDLPGGRLWAHRQPDRIPRPSGAGRGAGVTMGLACSRSWSGYRASPLPHISGLLALASLFYRDSSFKDRAAGALPGSRARPQRGAVISGCLEAVSADRRPDDKVLVVADRCTDETAAIARRAGASVLERGPGPRSQGGRPRVRPASTTRAALEPGTQ